MEGVQDSKVDADIWYKEILNENSISKGNKAIIQEYYSDLLVMSNYKDETICNKLQILPLNFETHLKKAIKY